MTIHRRPTPTISTNQTSHGHQNRLVVFLISGQGYFTFLYQPKGWKKKKNKQSQAWVSSKHKKGEVCDTIVHSVGLRERVLEQNSHKATRNADSFSQPGIFKDLSRLSASSNFCRLVCSLDWSVLPPSLDCSVLPTDLRDLPSLVLFRSRRRSRAQALCVDFAPKQTKGSSDWHPHNECPTSCHKIDK